MNATTPTREWPETPPKEGFPFVMDWDNGKGTPVRLFRINGDGSMSLARACDIEAYASQVAAGGLERHEARPDLQNVVVEAIKEGIVGDYHSAGYFENPDEKGLMRLDTLVDIAKIADYIRRKGIK